MTNRKLAGVLVMGWVMQGCAGMARVSGEREDRHFSRTPQSVNDAGLNGLPVQARIPLTGGADWVGIGFDSVWVKTSSSVIRIDPVTNSVVATIPEATCRGFSMGFGRVWTVDCSGKVLGIDPFTNRVVDSIPVRLSGGGEGSISAGEGGVWVITSGDDSSSDNLSLIDPGTHQVVSSTRIPSGSNGVQVTPGAVWVTNSNSATVTRVSSTTHQVVATVSVHPSPRFITADSHAVWVENQTDGTVSRINPATNAVTATIQLGSPAYGGDIKAGEGGIWVSASGTPVRRIDPTSNQVTYKWSGSAGDALNVGLGAIWLPASGPNGPEIWRIDPTAIPNETSFR